MTGQIPRWTPDQLAERVATRQPVLVDVRADWCRQCSPQEQALDRVVGDYIPRVIIGSIDAGDHPEFVDRWGIRSLPTFLLFQNGDHHETVSGYRRAPELSALLDRLAAKRT